MQHNCKRRGHKWLVGKPMSPVTADSRVEVVTLFVLGKALHLLVPFLELYQAVILDLCALVGQKLE